MADENTAADNVEISFKVKTSGEKTHAITMSETATVLDLKNKLASPDFEDVPADRQRLIYSGRVLKNEEPLKTYKIKAGNTIHMVKSAASNAAQNPAPSASSTSAAAAGIPTNMASGTANNPLAGLTGARYAGHVNLPGREMFGADGGMGAPPSEEQLADILSNPNTAQLMNEALSNPQMIDFMIQSNPMLRNMGPQAREMLQSPMFRQMMTDPNMLRQAMQMRRMFGGGPGEGQGAFPAPGATDTTPEGAASSTPGANAGSNTTSPPPNPFGIPMPGTFGSPGTGAAANPFASLFGNPAFGGATSPPAGQQGSGTPGAQGEAGSPPPNPFASLFGGAPPNLPPIDPEMFQQFMSNPMLNPFAGGAGGASSSPQPPDNRPPEERYADQLRQLNDMGFYDFDRNVEALRRSGGSVQGAIDQLLR